MRRAIGGPSQAAALLAVTAVLIGCPKELPRNLSADELYETGKSYHAEKKYDRAIEALQRLLLQDPNHPKADSGQYLIGDSYFRQKRYLTAGAEFLRLAQNRPAGELADDSRYRACESYYNLSPRAELDQEYTIQAIDQCRSVVLLYPGSPFAPKATTLVRELRDKLAIKELLTAEYYFKRKAYDSAIVYLDHLLTAYRGARVEPEALLMLFRSHMKLGDIEEAESIRDRLVREYPDTRAAQEVREVNSDEAG